MERTYRSCGRCGRKAVRAGCQPPSPSQRGVPGNIQAVIEARFVTANRLRGHDQIFLRVGVQPEGVDCAGRDDEFVARLGDSFFTVESIAHRAFNLRPCEFVSGRRGRRRRKSRRNAFEYLGFVEMDVKRRDCRPIPPISRVLRASLEPVADDFAAVVVLELPGEEVAAEVGDCGWVGRAADGTDERRLPKERRGQRRCSLRCGETSGRREDVRARRGTREPSSAVQRRCSTFPSERKHKRDERTNGRRPSLASRIYATPLPKRGTEPGDPPARTPRTSKRVSKYCLVSNCARYSICCIEPLRREDGGISEREGYVRAAVSMRERVRWRMYESETMKV